MNSPKQGSLSHLLEILIMTVVYCATARLGLALAIPPGLATAVWPPSGFALAALLLRGNRLWPGIWLGSFIANALVLFPDKGLTHLGISVLVIFSIAWGSVLQALLGAYLIRKLIAPAERLFEHMAYVFQFAGVEILACMSAATVGTASLWIAHFIMPDAVAGTWITWWLGDFVGVMVIVPACLCVAQIKQATFLKGPRIVEALLFLLLLVVQCHLVFSRIFPYSYSLFPFVIWAAFRFREIGVAAASLIVSFATVASTIKGEGIFTIMSPDRYESLLYAQAFIAVYTLTGMAMASILQEGRRNAEEILEAEESLSKLAEKLDRSNKELEQFAYTASHDLQEPLRVITMYLDLLSARYKGKLDKQADDFIEYARAGADESQKLIRSLLEYAKVGSQGKSFKLTDLEAVLKQVLLHLELSILESNAVITHDPLPKIKADSVQMVQLIQNLISNAIKYRSPSRPLKIHVSWKKEESNLIFSVSDNGIGVDPQYQERIFGIFQRLHSKSQGAGIGLAICKKIVERHNGKIWIQSEPDAGSTFYFSIPSKLTDQ